MSGFIVFYFSKSNSDFFNIKNQSILSTDVFLHRTTSAAAIRIAETMFDKLPVGFIPDFSFSS
jgi:hypothetical protein